MANAADYNTNGITGGGQVKDTEVTAAVERVLAQQKAEAQRDVAVVAATDESLRRQNVEMERDIVLTAAAQEAEERRVAELRASQASMNANQAWQKAAHLETERSVLRSDLTKERDAASRASFGFTMIVSLVLATLLGLGVWYYFKTQDDHKAQDQATAKAVSDNARSITATKQAAAAKSKETRTPILIQTPPPVIIKQPVTRVEIRHEVVPAPTPDGVGPGPDTQNTDKSDTSNGKAGEGGNPTNNSTDTNKSTSDSP